MRKSFGSVRAAAFVVLAVTTPFCLAVDTHVWQQNEQAEFERGTAKNISIRSDGRLTLAPAFKELLDASVPYLWTVTQDSKGTLYCAGGAPTGATTKIFSVTPDGKSKTFAELNGLEIHVLAVDSKDRIYAAVLPDAKIYRSIRPARVSCSSTPSRSMFGRWRSTPRATCLSPPVTKA